MLQPQPGADGYITFPCGARAGGPDWNRISLPVGWTEVEIYVTDILWNDGNSDVTNLDQSGTHAIQVSNVAGENFLLTQTNPNNPNLLTIVQSGPNAQLLASATNDSFVDDNYGGYVLRVRKHGPGGSGVRLN